MSGLANSGIKETKEALANAVEEIKELEAELALLQDTGYMTNLLAENQKLREALEIFVSYDDREWATADSEPPSSIREVIRIAKAALEVKDD